MHPRSTHGVLIRVYPDGSVSQPADAVSVPPGLSGIAKVIVATSDASLAADAYGRGLALHVAAATVDDERGVRSIVCTPPKGGVIELVSALDTTKPFAQDIERAVKDKGEGMYALVLRAQDPHAAASLLQSRGVVMGGPGGLEASVYGARFLLA